MEPRHLQETSRLSAQTLRLSLLYLGWKEERPTLQSWLWSPAVPASELHSVSCPPPPALHWRTTHTHTHAHINTWTAVCNASTHATLMGGTSMIFSTFCREQGTYHSAALLASFMAPASKDRRLTLKPEQHRFIHKLSLELDAVVCLSVKVGFVES